MDVLQNGNFKKAERNQSDLADKFDKHLSNLKMENLKLKETIHELTAQ